MRTTFLAAATAACLGLSGAAWAGPVKAGPAKPAAAAAKAADIGDKVPAFSATLLVPKGDALGEQPFDSRRAKGAVAYVFLGTTCPASKMYSQRLEALAGQFGKRGVQFVYVYPNKTDAAEAKRAFHREQGLSGPLVDDQDARIAKLLGVTKTSEVVVVDKGGTIVYRGAVDDNRDAAKVKRSHLSVALDEALSGKRVGTPKTEVFA